MIDTVTTVEVDIMTNIPLELDGPILIHQPVHHITKEMVSEKNEIYVVEIDGMICFRKCRYGYKSRVDTIGAQLCIAHCQQFKSQL
jgi:hypothetical protein